LIPSEWHFFKVLQNFLYMECEGAQVQRKECMRPSPTRLPGVMPLKLWLRRFVGLALLCFILLRPSSSPLAGRMEEAPVRVVLALDTSGSMKKHDPLRLLPKAATVMVNLLEGKDELGLMRFDESPHLLLKPGPLASNHRRQCLKELKRLAPRGLYTDIPALLDAALKSFPEAASSSRALILITDGQVDLDPREGSAESSLKRLHQEIIPSYQQAGIPIFTVAFTPDSDQKLLGELAAGTRGSFFLVDEAAALHRALVRIYEELKNPQLAPLVDNRFVIDQEVKEAVLIASRASPSRPVAVTDPVGRTVTPEQVPPQIRWLESPAFDMVTLRQPPAGVWEVGGLKQGEGTVTLLTDLQLLCPHIPPEIGSDEELIVGAAISDHGRPVTHAEFLKEAVFSAELTPENGAPIVAELTSPPAEQRQCWPPGTRTASFPPLNKPGTASLAVRVQGRTFQRERHFFLKVATPWFREKPARDTKCAGPGLINFLPGERGLPGDLHGWVSVQPASGGVAATLICPNAGNFALSMPGNYFRPAGIAARLAGVTPAGRPVAIRPAPVRSEAATPDAVAALSQSRVSARLQEKLRSIRARLRPWAWAFKAATLILLAAGLAAAGVLLTRRYGWGFLQPSPGSRCPSDGDSQERLLLLAQIESLQKAKADLAAKLSQFEAKLKRADTEKAGLTTKLEQHSQRVQEKAKIIADLEKKLQDAKHEADAVQQEYMALYARNQEGKGLLRKG
jgi:Mg-chelatase subunit ChlD